MVHKDRNGRRGCTGDCNHAIEGEHSLLHTEKFVEIYLMLLNLLQTNLIQILRYLVSNLPFFGYLPFGNLIQNQLHLGRLLLYDKIARIYDCHRPTFYHIFYHRN